MPDNSDLPVVLSEAAIADMSDIGRWIAERADPATAEAYVSRVEAACYRLGTFPNRGTPRFKVLTGLRTVTFERRIIVAYRVVGGVVDIMRLIDAARDFAGAFKGE